MKGGLICMGKRKVKLVTDSQINLIKHFNGTPKTLSITIPEGLWYILKKRADMANMSMMDFLKNVLAQIGLIHANQTSASQTEYGKLQASAFDDMMEKAKENAESKRVEQENMVMRGDDVKMLTDSDLKNIENKIDSRLKPLTEVYQNEGRENNKMVFSDPDKATRDFITEYGNAILLASFQLGGLSESLTTIIDENLGDKNLATNIKRSLDNIVVLLEDASNKYRELKKHD
jgi:hypothetical protein